MTINDSIENITLQKELKNIKEQLKTIQDENTKLKTTIDLYCKADAEKTEAIATLTTAIYRLSEEKQPTISYSELLAIHTEDVETIDMLNIKVRDLNNTISTLLDRVSKSDKENQELKKKVQDLNDFIQRI